MDDDIYFSRKKYVHECKLPKSAESIDELLPDVFFIRKKFRKFCLISPHVCHRRIYAKSTKVLEKERKYHLLNHYRLIHPFSEFSYYWGIFMLIINTMQLVITPITIINRVTRDAVTLVLVFTLLVGNINIILRFCTGYYRYDIKEVVLEPKKIAKHYIQTFFIPDLIGNFPLRSTLELFKIEQSVRFIFKLAIAFNAANFIRNLEIIREKRDLDLIVVKLLSCFAVAGLGLIWFSALNSLTANQSYRKCTISMWRLMYINFILMTGSSVDVVFDDYELAVRTATIAFGFVMKFVILIHLILFFKTYILNRLKKARLLLEIKEFCNLKMLPLHLKQKIFDYYEFKLQNVYFNESDIWTLLSESMRQNLLDYNTKEWFEGDIFKLCPLALRQLITIHLDKEVFLKRDVIYTQEDVLSRIYFIKTGSVLLYDSEGNLAHVIEEGNFFSEKALLLKDGLVHIYKAVAAENCQLFSLKKEMFRKVIKNFPDEYRTILDILLRRNQYMIKNKNIGKGLKLGDYYISRAHSTKP